MKIPILELRESSIDHLPGFKNLATKNQRDEVERSICKRINKYRQERVGETLDRGEKAGWDKLTGPKLHGACYQQLEWLSTITPEKGKLNYVGILYLSLHMHFRFTSGSGAPMSQTY